MQKIMLSTHAGFIKPKEIFKIWLPVILMMLLAAIIRLRVTSATDYYLLEGDGPYYPLQVRNLLEHFRLGLPDVPLLFLFEALLAKCLQFLHLASAETSIVMAVSLTDSFLPPLAAIPVFLIAQELQLNKRITFFHYLMVAFAILNFSTISIFSQGLHKNAVGVIFIFYYSYFIIRILKYSHKKDIYKALLVLVLCALTHFGSFSLLILLSCITGVILFLKSQTKLKTTSYKYIFISILFLALLAALIYVFDAGRFSRLVLIPLKIFEAPVILLAANGQDISALTNPIVLILFNLLAIYGLCVFIINRKKLNEFAKLSAFVFLLFCLFLISPFIGLEWANRLYMIAYIPLTVSYLILFSALSSKILKTLPVFIFLLIIVLSIVSGIQQPGFRTMTHEAFTEFKNMKDSVFFERNAVIIGRQDLRLLANWSYRIKGAADYIFTKEDFKKHEAVYVIRQVKGGNFSSNRHRGDAEIPSHANIVFCGSYFELYKLTSSENWNGGKGKTPTLRGTVEKIDETGFTVFNKWTESIRKVEFSKNTSVRLSTHKNLQKGMYVEVWGKGKPFSLTVKAEEVLEKE